MQHSILPSPILTRLLLALIGLLVFPALAQAVAVDAGQWEMTADKLTRHENPPTIIAEGNVLLEKKEALAGAPKALPAQADLLEEKNTSPQKPDSPSAQPSTALKTVTMIKADWISYDVTRGLLTAKGNLLIDTGANQLAADSGIVDLENSTGSFAKATVIQRTPDMHVEGKVIEKTGVLTYQMEDGWIITCKLRQGEVPPWSFAASDIEITDGGYAFLTHATFRIKDVPILYSPVMLLPAKRKRQTGLLLPSFSSSDRDGYGLEIPFFLNLSPSTDLTLYPRYLANRGLMLGGEFRYVLGEDSKGMVMGNFLDDPLSDPSEVDYYREGQFTHTNSDRYWIRGKADQDIGPWVTRLDLDIASDLDYLREFDTGPTGFTASQDNFSKTFGRGFIDETNRYRENSLVALRSWQNGTSLLVEGTAVNDISERVYSANDPSRAWTLPSLTYSGLVPIAAVSDLDFFWDANYTNFWRDEGVGAQRIDLLPMVSIGIPLSPYLESTITAGLRNTSYLINDNGASDWEDSDSENRFLSRFNGEIGTSLARDYSVNIGDVTAWNHLLRPFVAYTYTSIADKKLLPQFDAIDELEDENAVFYGINTFASISGERNGHEFEREYAFLKAKQGFDLRGEAGDKPLTPIIVEAGFYPLQQLRFKYTTNIDVYGEGAFLHSLDGDYSSSDGDNFSLDYRFNKRTNVNSVRGTFLYRLPYNFAVGYSVEQAIEQDEIIEEIASLQYIQPCWSIEVTSTTTPGDQTFVLAFSLSNIGSSFGLNF